MRREYFGRKEELLGIIGNIGVGLFAGSVVIKLGMGTVEGIMFTGTVMMMVGAAIVH